MRKQVILRLDEGELAAVDRARGLVSRQAWIRELCLDGARAASALRSAVEVPEPVKEKGPVARLVLGASGAPERPIIQRRG